MHYFFPFPLSPSVPLFLFLNSSALTTFTLFFFTFCFRQCFCIISDIGAPYSWPCSVSMFAVVIAFLTVIREKQLLMEIHKAPI